MTNALSPAKTAKSEATRQQLTEVAIGLLKKQGATKTTMRQIAAEAGMSLGNAYYYYKSKDEIVQELYRRITAEHNQKSVLAIAGKEDFSERLSTVLQLGFELMQPYHSFATEFLGSAISPDSESNPFGEAASEARTTAIGMFESVLQGSKLKLTAELKTELPELLWLAYMAGILFWVYDKSPNQQKTQLLISRLVPLAAQLLSLANLPFIKSQVSELLELAKALKQ